MDKNPDSNKSVIGLAVVILVVGTLIVGGLTHRGSSTPQATDVVQTQSDNGLGGERAGLQEFQNGVKMGPEFWQWYGGTFVTGQTSAKLYCNTTGRSTVAEYGDFSILSGFASSSMKVSIFATTSSSIATTNDFATVVATTTALIAPYVVATSSEATTTSSTLAAIQNKGNGEVIVQPNWCVWAYMQSNSATGCTGAAAGMCEAASSTNRGFNPTFKIRVHSDKALP